MLAQKADGDDESDVDDNSDHYNFCNVGSTAWDPIRLRNSILLDNQSTVNMFCNKRLVSQVWTMKNRMTISGNGGTLTTNKKALVNNYGKVWFNECAIINVLLLNLVHKKYKVTYNNMESIFTVHKPDGKKVHFNLHLDGLHYHDTGSHQLTLVNTVAKNELRYSKCQVEGACLACKFQSIVGFPSTCNLKAIITSNQIANCPVTVHDIEWAENIYRPSVPSLKGKTTHTMPSPVVSDYVAVPPEILSANCDVMLTGDIFFVNQAPFLATVSENIQLMMAQYIKDCTAPTLLVAILKVQAIYHARGFSIRCILMDNEFELLCDNFMQNGIDLNVPAANEHIPKLSTRSM